ncbi:MAG TPA: hypothetical protein DEP48_00915 [Persephonella sp.]|uniref:Uncharacterized protein n=1 Tax=Persephonella marina (strain DSM 14350 / EX-H1) TaxID=123214 RepID=C0QR52_PERMH|nr:MULTISPECIES: hypothetical protein [Persephonella]ACO03691.1 hypothetical protein PERMA_1379 [Persephonella marina EX-H1]HCB68896.1 hypothetical protein [Persephonella sp.]
MQLNITNIREEDLANRVVRSRDLFRDNILPNFNISFSEGDVLYIIRGEAKATGDIFFSKYQADLEIGYNHSSVLDIFTYDSKDNAVILERVPLYFVRETSNKNKYYLIPPKTPSCSESYAYDDSGDPYISSLSVNYTYNYSTGYFYNYASTCDPSSYGLYSFLYGVSKDPQTTCDKVGMYGSGCKSLGYKYYDEDTGTYYLENPSNWTESAKGFEFGFKLEGYIRFFDEYTQEERDVGEVFYKEKDGVGFVLLRMTVAGETVDYLLRLDSGTILAKRFYIKDRSVIMRYVNGPAIQKIKDAMLTN